MPDPEYIKTGTLHGRCTFAHTERMPEQPMQNYAVLFADIAGSMNLYNRLGDEDAKTLIVKLQQQQSDVIVACGGTVQEFIGDEIMARFTNCENAVAASIRLHQLAEEYSGASAVNIQMRVGLHYGPAIVESGRMFGDTVNIAARVAAIARSGQTITSEALVSQLPPAQQASARHYDVTKIKGKYGLLDIFELMWNTSGQTTMMLAPDVKTAGHSLTLTFCGVSTRLALTTEKFGIGRANANDLVVHANSVSRQHITIEVTRGRFVVCDDSTNGTYVYLSNGEVIYLRREQLPVWGAGKIALGAPIDEGQDHLLGYVHEHEQAQGAQDHGEQDHGEQDHGEQDHREHDQGKNPG